MDHYLEIQLLADPEFPAPILMNALFAKLHRVLVQRENKRIGISFPTATPNHLGQRLRLHGTAAELDGLMAQPWLKGMRDHTEVSAIVNVPGNAQHIRVQRMQAKSSAERLRRRYLHRHPGTTEEEVRNLIPGMVEKKLNLPYLRLKSTSSGQDFALFLQQSQAGQPVAGEFNGYGLSRTATVPWF
ncbi:MAG TPA: type I-F CRISPR-associated endoribonuclease Cas6/Csy4 [Pseudomonas xinjiangensis]|uniref:Type I-F CRISPR-associated endoribonuclease Cas6/Csy4 n=2 Tax=root TaxID=1 RepID=A0A7V1BM82_9GAMM|nr:type I-F CRISPR-associated endoribonuclease Cas6/Csy4 [Halopseudomonas xinjiangensis]HEC47061.1 type I-F CRISPR-associated endoribonuclease Cas6/Csy4 [Halopseudomonas xinjiangensis]